LTAADNADRLAPMASSAGLRLRLTALLALVVFGAVAMVAFGAAAALQRAAAPELDKRTRLIGIVLRAEVQRALELGIALDAIAGLDRYLAETLDSFGEIDRIVVRTIDGRAVASVARATGAGGGGAVDGAATGPPTRGRLLDGVTGRMGSTTTLPMLDGNRVVGTIEIEVSPAFVQTRLRNILLDVLTLAGVATLLALEGVLAVVAVTATAPLRRLHSMLRDQAAGDFRHCMPGHAPGAIGRVLARLNDHAFDLAERAAALPAALRAAVLARVPTRIAEGRPRVRRLADLGDIRVALLLFSTASEITVAFLPVYTGGLARPDWLSPEAAAAAPLLCYLLAMLALAPVAGRIVDRIGARRLFLASVAPTLLALGGLLVATHVAEVMAWRAVMAVFYATATIACQVYAMRAADSASAARPGATFVTVVHGGVFCGSVVGGVIAGRFGIGAALVAGAAVAVLAGLVAMLTMRGDAGRPLRTGRTQEGGRLVSIAGATPGQHAGPGSPEVWPPTAGLPTLLLGLAVPMSAATAVAVWYLTPLMLHASGSGAGETARVVMLYYLAVVLIAPGAARMADGRLGPRRAALVGATLAALALGIGARVDGLWGLVAAMSVLGVGHALQRATLLALALRMARPGQDGAAALRVHERVGAIVGLAGCALALPTAGPQIALAVLGLITIAGMLTFAFLGRQAASDALAGGRR
jgi:hypothetical protein